MPKAVLFITIAAFLSCIRIAQSATTTLYQNFTDAVGAPYFNSTRYDVTTNQPGGNDYVAVSFVGNGLRLAEIDFAAVYFDPSFATTSGFVNMFVESDSGGFPNFSPSAFVEAWTTPVTQNGGVIGLTSTSTPLLTLGTTYWVVMQRNQSFPPGSSESWYANASGATGLAIYVDTGGWTSRTTATPTLRVLTTSAVPEPATWMLMAAGTVLLTGFQRLRKS
jgi:hypothetical protein